MTGVQVVIQKREKGEGGEGEKTNIVNLLHRNDFIRFILPPVCAVAGLDDPRLVEVGRGLLLSQAQ